MSILFAETLIAALGVYLGLGALFALPFVIWGVARIDPRAAGGSIGFRLLILPGVAALWPLFAWRWLRGQGPPEERTAHSRAAEREQRG